VQACSGSGWHFILTFLALPTTPPTDSAIMHTAPSFHPMIEVVDLTLSSDEDAETAAALPYGLLPSLPLRTRDATQGCQLYAGMGESSRKRCRESTPHPRSGILHRKRPRCNDEPKHYLQGVLKPVRLAGTVRQHDITLPEVLQIEHLEEAVLCSYQWDADWLMEDLGLAGVKTTWVGCPRHMDRLNARWPHRHTIFPAQPSQPGSVHGKLMLLFRSDGFLRIAVPTANLRRQEWGAPPQRCWRRQPGQTSTLDNAVFIIDLPREQGGYESDSNRENHFRASLLAFLQCLGLGAELMAKVRLYDFQEALAYAFVYTG
jgi:hypothetical protein